MSDLEKVLRRWHNVPMASETAISVANALQEVIEGSEEITPFPFNGISMVTPNEVRLIADSFKKPKDTEIPQTVAAD
jgi:hypothetical protein